MLYYYYYRIVCIELWLRYQTLRLSCIIDFPFKLGNFQEQWRAWIPSYQHTYSTLAHSIAAALLPIPVWQRVYSHVFTVLAFPFGHFPPLLLF